MVNTGASCPVVAGKTSGFQVWLNAGGYMPTGPAVAIGAGQSMVPNVSWPIGYKFTILLKDLCTGQYVSTPLTTTIQ